MASKLDKTFLKALSTFESKLRSLELPQESGGSSRGDFQPMVHECVASLQALYQRLAAELAAKAPAKPSKAKKSTPRPPSPEQTGDIVGRITEVVEHARDGSTFTDLHDHLKADLKKLPLVMVSEATRIYFNSSSAPRTKKAALEKIEKSIADALQDGRRRRNEI